MAVKFQQVDVAVDTARAVCFQNRVLIALALRGYLAHGHQGLIMPCAYLRPKAGDRAETGIAYLVGPHPDFKPVSRHEFGDRWDEAIGTSTATMLADFAREVGRVIDQAPRLNPFGHGAVVGRPVFLSMELRPVSTLGNLDSRIAVLGSDVLVTMPNPGSNLDSAWDFVAEAGFASLAHLPIASVELQANGSLRTL